MKGFKIMRRHLILTLSLLMLSCNLCSPSLFALDLSETIAPENIKKGMKGYGLTVFGGTKIERFEVEVLGVIDKKGPNRSLILAKVSGNILEHSGVIAGMSGSPVYIEGKLAGALAYAWSFAKDAIAGIQPISGMHALAERTTPLGAAEIVKSTHINLSDSTYNSPSVMSTIQTPVFIDGFNSKAAGQLELMFKRFGMLPITTGSSISAGEAVKVSKTGGVKKSQAKGSRAEKGRNEQLWNNNKTKGYPEIKEGQAVAATLLSGDMNISAVGTITYRDGKKIVAFGHPFFGLGDIEIPMSRADIQTVLPSLSLSFKMANTMEPIGTLVRDGTTGIVGILGQKAPTVKVKLNLSVDGGVKKAYSFEAAKHPMLTSAMVGTALSSVLNEEISSLGPATIRVETLIKIKGHDVFNTSNYYTTELFPTSALQSGLSPVYKLLSSKYEDVSLEEVIVNATVEREVKSASIEGVRWQEKSIKPGDSLRAVVIVKPWKKPLTFIPFTLKIPDDVPEGKLKINVAAARNFLLIDRKRFPEKYTPESVDRLMEFYESVPDFKQIALSYSYGGKGITLNGDKMRQLPLSLISVADGTKGLEFGKVEDAVTKFVDTKWITTGMKSFSVQIKQEN